MNDDERKFVPSKVTPYQQGIIDKGAAALRKKMQSYGLNKDDIPGSLLGESVISILIAGYHELMIAIIAIQEKKVDAPVEWSRAQAGVAANLMDYLTTNHDIKNLPDKESVVQGLVGTVIRKSVKTAENMGIRAAVHPYYFGFPIDGSWGRL